MKYRKEPRQFDALNRLFDDIAGYQEMIKNPPKTLKVGNKVLEGEDVGRYLNSKLSKSEKCVENLKAKGITPKAE